MKKILRACVLGAALLSFGKSNAQCTVGGSVLSNIAATSDATGCNVTFDLTVPFSGNGGQSAIVIYIWDSTTYVTNILNKSFYGGNSQKTPTAADLDASGALATIKLRLDSAVSAYRYQQLTPSNFSHPASMKSGLTYTAANGVLTIQGITVRVNDCSSVLKLKADVASAQSTDINNLNCVGTTGAYFTANEPQIRTQNLGGCTSTGQMTVQFITKTQRDITFEVFKDVAPFGQFTAADTASANLRYTSPLQTITGTGTVNVVNYTRQNGDKDMWVVAYTTGINNPTVSLVENSCAALPVSFKSISATRTKQNVLVKWETASEANNNGFNVQRLIGGGNWETIAFVPTQAANGNSNSVLTYTYTNLNPTKAISQYRVQQVDIDGNAKYSEIRSVRGEEMSNNIVVYPNPSSNGSVNLMFDDAASVRDILVNDATGRTVRSYKGVINNNLVIENLQDGFYSIQVINQTSAAVSVEKIVIKRK